MTDNENRIGILLIEDSLTIIELVKIWLEEGLPVPYDLRTAGSLASGLQVLEKNTTDIIVLDLNLPDSEGLDTFTRVHAHGGRTPIVIMSGESDQAISLEAVRLGAQDYIVKGSFGGENPLTRPLLFAYERNARQKAEQELQETREQVWLARSVQQQLFPGHEARIAGFDVSGRCEPADLTGGDYFDFIPMLDGKWGIVIGDVCGHGLASALFMVSARAVLRSFVVTYDDPGFMMSQVNRVLEDDLTDGRFVTLLFVCVNPLTKSFRFASAGHPGFVLDADGDLQRILEADSPPIGVIDDQKFRTSDDERLQPGDILLLYTDGVTESYNSEGDIFEREQLFEVVRENRHRSAQQIIDAVFTAVREFSGDEPQHDDITVVVAKYLG